MILDGQSLQEHSVNAGVLQSSTFGTTLVLLYINDLPDDVTCNIAIHADNSTLYCKWEQASDIWQQLELAPELESDQPGTESDLLISMLEKLSLFRLTLQACFIFLFSIFLNKNHLFQCWDYLSLLNWIKTHTLFLLLKLPPRKLESWFTL